MAAMSPGVVGALLEAASAERLDERVVLAGRRDVHHAVDIDRGTHVRAALEWVEGDDRAPDEDHLLRELAERGCDRRDGGE